MTTDAVTVRKEARAAALASVGASYTAEQIDVIKNTVAVGATDSELALFLTVSQRTGLDPFTKQIHFVKRWDSTRKMEVGAHQVGIDGFRVIAQRSAKYRGRVGPWWCGRDGAWKDLWTDEANPPFAAKVGVVMEGWPEPVYAMARFSAYAQYKKDGGLTRFWATMGPEQLAKCAEALALRIAVPNDLSGLLIPEEMGTDETPQEVKSKPAARAAKRDAEARTNALRDVEAVIEAGGEYNEVGDAPADEAAVTDDAPTGSPMSDEDRAAVVTEFTVLEMAALLIRLRDATKGVRRFVEVNAKGRHYLCDGEILTNIGQVRQGAPVNAWLDNLRTAEKPWFKLACETLRVARELNVEVIL